MKKRTAPLAETMIPAVRYGKQQITLTEEQSKARDFLNGMRDHLVRVNVENFARLDPESQYISAEETARVLKHLEDTRKLKYELGLEGDNIWVDDLTYDNEADKKTDA